VKHGGEALPENRFHGRMMAQDGGERRRHSRVRQPRGWPSSHVQVGRKVGEGGTGHVQASHNPADQLVTSILTLSVSFVDVAQRPLTTKEDRRDAYSTASQSIESEARRSLAKAVNTNVFARHTHGVKEQLRLWATQRTTQSTRETFTLTAARKHLRKLGERRRHEVHSQSSDLLTCSKPSKQE
jgi:hypothetical protein